MPASDAERVRAFFARPGMGWILDRLADRMSRGRPLRGVIARAGATLEERRALDDLLGRRSTTGKQLSLDLAELEQTLRSSGMAETLEDAVEACRGRVENRRASAEQERAEWDALFARLGLHQQGWIAALARDGSLKRLARGDLPMAARLMERAIRVVSRDPRDEVLLANLAAVVAGDSHALDRAQPLATLCFRAIATLHGIDGQESAGARRKAWAAIGVIIDDLSAPVLVFNLRAAAGSPLESILALHREQGQPAFLTYRQLQGGQPLGETVFVCENPSVVSAAARELGPQCRPLVCTNGQPTSATHLLLSQLRRAGADLRCHADFDWAGLRIVEQLVREHGAVPWRMTAADYGGIEGSVRLEAQSFVTDWEPELGDCLRARGTAVFEEQVMKMLIGDLASGL